MSLFLTQSIAFVANQSALILVSRQVEIFIFHLYSISDTRQEFKEYQKEEKNVRGGYVFYASLRRTPYL